MGNRILKESIRMSPEIDALTWFEEVLFYRLIVTADDYGVCPADPVVLAHMLFPRKENVSRKMAEEALNRLEALGLIHRYTAEGERYLCLTSWSRHQRLRSTVRKYPGPEQAQEEAEAAPEAAPEKEASGTKEKKRKKRGKASSGPETGAAEAEPPLIKLSDVDEYRTQYPAVDVLQLHHCHEPPCLPSVSGPPAHTVSSVHAEHIPAGHPSDRFCWQSRSSPAT